MVFGICQMNSDSETSQDDLYISRRLTIFLILYILF